MNISKYSREYKFLIYNYRLIDIIEILYCITQKKGGG